MTDPTRTRDHGGGLDAAIARFGGTREVWIDLSTGINPVPYPIGPIAAAAWADLPDHGAMDRLLAAARRFWGVPDGAAILAAPGASALIARIPTLAQAGTVSIPGPTYNEHAAAFGHAGWTLGKTDQAQVLVHPNNPDGRLWDARDLARARLTIIDESFCDIAPDRSLVAHAADPGVIVLKSFGKFWGLAGARLGFAIAAPATIATLSERLGPWPVSGPALEIGCRALSDPSWAAETRQRLRRDAAQLDAILTGAGAEVIGGTALFRLYEVPDAAAWQTRLAKAHIWSRIFPYSKTWLRLGLPHPDHWPRISQALVGGGR